MTESNEVGKAICRALWELASKKEETLLPRTNTEMRWWHRFSKGSSSKLNYLLAIDGELRLSSR